MSARAGHRQLRWPRLERGGAGKPTVKMHRQIRGSGRFRRTISDCKSVNLFNNRIRCMSGKSIKSR